MLHDWCNWSSLPLSEVISAFHMTAGYDYTPGPYTVTFTAGDLYATLMLSTMDDNTTELSEYFSVMITSTDQPSAAEIGSHHMAFITIEDNDPGIYVYICKPPPPPPPPHSASYNIMTTATSARRVSALVGHRKRPPVQVTADPGQHQHHSNHHICHRVNALDG